MTSHIQEHYHPDGTVEIRRHYYNNMLHREDGPAYERFYKDGAISARGWCIHNKFHREDGPAIEYFFLNGSCAKAHYYLNDKPLSELEYMRQVALLKLAKKSAVNCEVSL